MPSLKVGTSSFVLNALVLTFWPCVKKKQTMCAQELLRVLTVGIYATFKHLLLRIISSNDSLILSSVCSRCTYSQSKTP